MSSRINYKRSLFTRFLVPIGGALALLLSTQTVHAKNGWQIDFLAVYPQAGTTLTTAANNCTLCHAEEGAAGKTRNVYGQDLEPASDSTIRDRLVAIEGLNSDGDTGTDDGIACSNITEINADTLPGDAGSTPTTCGANQPPIADAGGPYTGTAGQPVLFDGSGSSDTDGTVDQYDWDYGDGTLAPNAGPTPSHTYALPDDYTVSLTVTDNDGDTGSATTTASIAAAPEDPIANPGGPYEGTEGVELAFDGRASEDPDGGSITQYDWDFGDGNVGTGPEPSHTYATAGTYTVTLTVVDDEGVTSAPATTEAVIGSDQDGDGIADAQDNCILDANADQRDTDGDNYGNICDPDFNGDLVVNATDLAYMKVNFFGTDPDADLDGDGFVNAADLAILKNFFFQAPGPSGLVP